MTEDEKKMLEEEFRKAGSVPALLEAMARSETMEFQDLCQQVEQGPHHPTGNELYDYVLGWMDKEDSLLVMDHLLLCSTCLREVIRIRSIEEALTEDALARADRVPLLERLKGLISKLSFPVSIYEPARIGVRGTDQALQERRYCPKEDLGFSMEAPADGYITVFHGCEETGEVKLVFPESPDDNPKLAAGQQLGRVDGTVDGPQGEHFLKLFWTRSRLLDLTKVDPDNEEEVETAIVRFLEAINALPEEDWATESIKYEVLDEDKPGNP